MFPFSSFYIFFCFDPQSQNSVPFCFHSISLFSDFHFCAGIIGKEFAIRFSKIKGKAKNIDKINDIGKFNKIPDIYLLVFFMLYKQVFLHSPLSSILYMKDEEIDDFCDHIIKC